MWRNARRSCGDAAVQAIGVGQRAAGPSSSARRSCSQTRQQALRRPSRRAATAAPRRARPGTSRGRAPAGRRARSRAPASAGGSGSTGRAARGARASRAPRRTRDRRGTPSAAGRTSRASSSGSSHSTDTASSARLVFAIATSPPNWIISGSFSYCGAPPDIEIAVAIVSALRTAAIVVAAKAATQSAGVRDAVGGLEQVEHRQRRRRGEREVGQVERQLERRLAVDEERGPGPEQHRQEVVAGRQQEEADDGRELAQRERVLLAPEVDVDDLELGGEEGGRHEVPRDDDGRLDRAPGRAGRRRTGASARPTSRALNRATRSGAGTRRSEPAARVGPTLHLRVRRREALGRRSPASRSASSISHSIRRRPQGGRHRLG